METKSENGIALRRILSFIIDWNLILLVCIFFISYGSGFDKNYFLRPSITMFSSPGVIVGALALIVLPIIKDCVFGHASLGKLLFGLKVTGADGTQYASFGSLLLRNITFYIPVVEFIVLLANNGKTLGDMISKTTVMRKKDIIKSTGKV